MRVIALLLLFAVLPTVELTEQAVHLVEHVIHADLPDHAAHHDDTHGDEHGCTGLVHLCSGDYTQVTAGVAFVAFRVVEVSASLSIAVPASLVDLTSQEPAHRPPIG